MGGTPPASGPLNLFEVVNHTLRERLLALTPAGLQELRRRVRADPPPEILHWGQADILDFKLRAPRLAPAQAEVSLRLFLARPRDLGWRLIPWRD